MNADTRQPEVVVANREDAGVVDNPRRRRLWDLGPIMLAVVLALGAYAFGASTPFRANQVTLWTIFGILALSLTLVWGRGGVFSFGQGALFGIGGYTYGVVSINFLDATNETLSAVLAAAVVAAASAAVLGYFMFYGNVGDVYVAIITLATSLVLLTFMGATAGPQWAIGDALLGGYNGVTGIPPITMGIPGGPSYVLGPSQMMAVTLVLATLVALGAHYGLRRPFGRVLAGLSDNPERLQLLGYDTRVYQLKIFTIGGAIAGLAGAGYAAWGLFINPAVFGLQQAALVVIWVLVGGRHSIVGAFVGAAVLQWLASRLGAGAGSLTPIILGGVLIGIVLLLPRGLIPSIIGGVQRFIPAMRRPPRPLPISRDNISPVDTGSGRAGVLATHEVSKVFGGLVAVDDVTLRFPEKGVHCLIGPNGAGKSTLFGLLIGRHTPSSGDVLLDGIEITRRRPDQRVRMGLGIKLQVPSIFPSLSVAENVWLAAYSHERDIGQADQQVADLLQWLELRDQAWQEASTLAHGQQQNLEIGVVLATKPEIILLDEPTAGMTRVETTRIVQLIQRIGESATVIVVEHDMTFVRQLDAPTTLLHQGSIFVSGTLEELRDDERVQDVYLGRAPHA